MAGAYPDPPSYRMAWHEDGTQLIDLVTGETLSEAARITLNDENGSTAPASTHDLALIFPELRDLDAVWLNSTPGGLDPFDPYSVDLEVSSNSTNGTNGDWSVGAVLTVTPDINAELGPGWREDIGSSTSLAVKAIRISAGSVHNLHIYGEIAPSTGLRRLEFWHPILDSKVPMNWFDWGSTPRQSSADQSFRIKNMSPGERAEDVVLSVSALTDTTPSVVAQHFVSLDGHLWFASVDVGSISALAITGIMYLRRVTPSNADLTPPRWAALLRSVPGSWT